MNNQQLNAQLSRKSGITAIEAAALQTACIDKIIEEISKGNTVLLQGLGNFDLKEKSERKMYNPTTKDYQVIPARQTLGFRPSNVLKEKIKG